MYKELLKQINLYKNISIFKHIRPDGDASFSSAALKDFIKINFKDKKVKICGFDEYDIYNPNEKVSDTFIKNSLAIVLDTSNKERVDDQRFLSAKAIIKIDHHPSNDDFGDLNFVKKESAACAEYLAEILFSKEFSKYKISEKCAEYLYCGILTDSINFKTTSTTANTLNIASKLASYGIDISALSDKVMAIGSDEFNKVTLLRKYFKIYGKLGICLLEEKDLHDIGLTIEKAKPSVAEFNNIRDINIWATIVYNERTGLYDSSLRSKRGYKVNTIAEAFNGGGHDCAAATSKMTKNDVKNLIKMLKNASK